MKTKLKIISTIITLVEICVFAFSLVMMLLIYSSSEQVYMILGGVSVFLAPLLDVINKILLLREQFKKYFSDFGPFVHYSFIVIYFALVFSSTILLVIGFACMLVFASLFTPKALGKLKNNVKRNQEKRFNDDKKE